MYFVLVVDYYFSLGVGGGEWEQIGMESGMKYIGKLILETNGLLGESKGEMFWEKAN